MADKGGAPLFKKEMKMAAAIGDWTVYRPSKPPAKKIKPLFYSHHRVSKDDLDVALEVHNFFANEFAKYMKSNLKASTEVFSVSLEQMSYLDFLKSVTQGLIYSKVIIKDVGEPMLLIDFPLANMAINFSLGCQSVENQIKEFSELEESIIKSVFGNLLDRFSACWKNVFEKPEMEVVGYPNVQRETHISLNDVLTIITTQVSIANSLPSSFTFVYQSNALRKLIDLLDKKEEKALLNFNILPDDLMSSIEVPLIAELGTSELSANEIAGMENEDLVSLDQKLNDPVRLYLGWTAEFKAQPGIRNGRLAVRLLPGSIKKIKAAPTLKAPVPESSEAARGAEGLALSRAEGPARKEAEGDFEFPMEEEGKEEYNEPQEIPGEDETPRSGGI